MAQKHVLLPLEVVLQCKIAMLEREILHLQARLLTSQAEAQHFQTLTALMQTHRICLPVPLAACTLDMDNGCLRYEVVAADDEETAMAPPPARG